jgi:Flp pilus assembly protein TadD
LLVLLLTACGGGQGPVDLVKMDADVGEVALNAGTPEVTLRLTEQTLASRPNDVGALTRRGQALTELGRLDEARDTLGRAVTLEPRNMRALLALGRVQLPVDPAKAEADFGAALEQDSRNAAALNDLGIAQDLLGRHQDAQGSYRAALAAQPGMVAAKVNLALCLAISGQGEQAIGMMRPLASQPDATPKIKEDYAAVLAMSGNRDEARRILSTALAPNEVAPALEQLASARSAAVSGSPPPGRVSEIPAPAPEARVTSPGTQAAPSEILASSQVTGGSDTAPETEHQPVAQLAAVPSEAAAHDEWEQLSKRMPDLLNGRQPLFTRVDRDGQVFWRVRTSGFTDVTEARNFCGLVRSHGGGCVALIS